MKKLSEIKQILVVAPIFSASDVTLMESFFHDIKQINAQINIYLLYWDGNKKKTKNKDYQRKSNEWNDSDFSFWGKLKNADISRYFESTNEVLIVFGEKLPEKVNQHLKRTKANLKIGFQKENNYFDVLFSLENNNLEEQIKMSKKYLL